MKRILVVGVLGTMLGAATAFAAGAMDHHPNLMAAHKLLADADNRIEVAQKANHGDMEGHAAKARDLIKQAQTELDAAAVAADKNGGKKK